MRTSQTRLLGFAQLRLVFMRTSQTRLLGFAQLRLVFMRTSQTRSPSTSLRSSAGFGSPAALRAAECSCASRGLAILRLRS